MAVFILSYVITLIFSAHTDKRAFRLRRNYLRVIFFLFNVRIEIRGKPLQETALYVSNHRTFFDPAATCAYLEAFVIAKAEIADYPLINKGAELTGVIWVKRESLISRKNTRETMVESLKAGRNILVYPEGTTNNQQKVLPFKKGTFKEMANLNMPVVPLVCEYRDPVDFWKGGSLVSQFFKQFSKWSTSIKLYFGPKLLSSDGEALRMQSEDWINVTLQEMYPGWSKAFSV